jgi:hypothetical protein
MDYIIDTVKDLKEVMNNLDLAPGTSPGDGELQHLRFPDNKVLIIRVTEQKYGNVVDLDSEMA